MNNNKVLFSCLFFTSLFLTACGGNSGGNNPQEGGATQNIGAGGTGIAGDSNSSGNTGNFDIVEYMFPDQVENIGGFTSYETRMFSKSKGEQLFEGLETSEQFERTAADTVVFSVNNTGEPANTFVINASSIEETVHGSDNQKRTLQRFVNIGDTYLDANATVNLGEPMKQNAKCSVIEHLDSFDLAFATGSLNLASGIFNDVLHVQCTTGFIVDGQVAPHTDLHHYFARDKGVIFNHGTVILMGDVYIIPQKEGTSAGTGPDNTDDGTGGGNNSGAARVNFAHIAGYRISGGDQNGQDHPAYQLKYESITFNCDNTATLTQESNQHGSFTQNGTYYTDADEIEFVDSEDYRTYIVGLVDGDVVANQSTWEGPTGLPVTEIVKVQECN